VSESNIFGLWPIILHYLADGFLCAERLLGRLGYPLDVDNLIGGQTVITGSFN